MPPTSNFGQDITNNNNNNRDGSTDNGGNGGDGGGDGSGDDGSHSPNIQQRIGGMEFFSRLAGKGVIRVVGRCEAAKENNNLDLSDCQLMQVPDAVYHLMRHTELKTCDLSSNVISKIPPKLALKFNLITDLNLSFNQIAKLPDELADLTSLLRLDISHNMFLVLPEVVFKMPKLRQLKANNNSIMDIDDDVLIESDSLELVDLRKNPLVPSCHERLKNARVSFHIELPENNWLDLDLN